MKNLMMRWTWAISLQDCSWCFTSVHAWKLNHPTSFIQVIKEEEKIYLGPHGAPPSQAKKQQQQQLDLNTAGRKQQFKQKLKEADRRYSGTGGRENKVEHIRELVGSKVSNIPSTNKMAKASPRDWLDPHCHESQFERYSHWEFSVKPNLLRIYTFQWTNVCYRVWRAYILVMNIKSCYHLRVFSTERLSSLLSLLCTYCHVLSCKMDVEIILQGFAHVYKSYWILHLWVETVLYIHLPISIYLAHNFFWHLVVLLGLASWLIGMTLIKYLAPCPGIVTS